MRQNICLTSLLVRDYDEAVSFFTTKLGFELRSDSVLSPDKRWVVVAPASGASGLLLAKAVDEAQRAAIGNQSGGRVFLFLETDNFARDHSAYVSRGVHFIEQPRHEAYGTVAVFEDLYGNRWDLIERAI
jgi:catechol 2,3-dioxygenase-like lactoylglutathione lyase family enzyme